MQPDPFRIAFFSYSGGMGGAEHSLLGLVKRLSPAHFEPVLFHIEQGAFIDEVRAAGITTVKIPLRANLARFRRGALVHALLLSPFSAISFVAWFIRFRQALRKYRIDCVHANQPKSHLLAMLSTGRLPYVLHMRDIFANGSLPGLLYRIFFSLQRGRIVAISHAVAAALSPRLRNCATVIHNGAEIPAQMKSMQEARAGLGISPGERVICCMGRLAPWKGIEMILEACASLPTGKRPLLLVVGGAIYWEAAYEEDLRQTAERLGIANRVRFVGYQKNISHYFWASEFLVHAAADEPFGRVLIEAAGHGRCALAFRCGGIPEIVEHEATGLLVDERSPVALAAGLTRLLDNAPQTALMGDNARERALRLFSIDGHVSRMQDLFMEILA